MISLLSIAGLLVGYEIGTWTAAVQERNTLFRFARATADASGKPLLVVGVPRGRHGYGDVTIDLNCDGHPSCMEADVTSLPFPSGWFGACFASHVLEHVGDIDGAMRELTRVSDQVFIAYPRPFTLVAWWHPDHHHLITQAPPEGRLISRKIA